MSDNAYRILMLIRSRKTGRTAAAKASQAISADLAFAAAHAAPDAEVERKRAVCRKCGADTDGVWQIIAGGNRLRTPTDHAAGFARTCPGAFMAAELRSPTERTDDDE